MYVRTAQLKGRRIVFDAPAEEGNAYSQLLHENRDGILSPRELMQLTSRDHTTDSQRELKLGQQFTLFLRYLEGPGQRHPLLKDRDFILEYLGHVSRITEEFEENNPIKVTPIAEATTEEEEARLAQQRTQRSQEYSQKAEARQKELLAKVIEAACPWTVEEWESLTKDYDRFARSR